MKKSNYMCRFSETSRARLGNVVGFIAAHAKYPYKTEVLKLLFLMEEKMTEGTLLYFNPFVFKNGATPKPKFFIVL